MRESNSVGSSLRDKGLDAVVGVEADKFALDRGYDGIDIGINANEQMAAGERSKSR